MTKVVYIAGPITDVPDYKRNFNKAANDLLVAGYTPLNPAALPQGMTKEQYMRICLAMLDCADAVLFLPGWMNSAGAGIEMDYSNYTRKPVVYTIAELKEVLNQ